MRLLKNKFANEILTIEKQGASKEVLAEKLAKGRAKKGMFEGDMENGELEIGQVSAMINTIQPAAEIVNEIWEDFQSGLKRLYANT